MSSYQDTLQQGATIGCYQIEEVLGRGGFAVTYLAVDQNLDVYVAIKEYLPREIITRTGDGVVVAREAEFEEDYETGLENFAREAKTLALFKHPNIVRVHQVLHENNTAYMVMDYEHGRELADVMEERKSLSEEELRPILFPVLDAVDEIHHQGYVHRDIKPSNIYLRDNGSPVLLDFGAARYTLSETTQQLTAVVTVGYTPIEQYNVSDADQGPWTDIYALSAVLYEAVTGEMPVDSVTRASSTLTNAADPLVAVRNKTLQPCTDAFYDAIDWGLQMDALDRPRSVGQWVDALNGKMLATPPPAEAPARDDSTRLKPERPKRASKLRTRAKSLAAAETDSHHRTSVELAMQDFDVEHYPDTRIEPRFGESLTDIDVGDRDETHARTSRAQADSAQADSARVDSAHIDSGRIDGGRIEGGQQDGDQFDSGHTSDGETAGNYIGSSQSPGTVLHSNGTVQRAGNTAGTAEPTPPSATSALRGNSSGSQAVSDDLQTQSDTRLLPPGLPTQVNSNGKTHTQEIRDVVRRDIMKRDVDAEPAIDATARQANNDRTQPMPAGTEGSTTVARRPGRILTRAQAAQADATATELPKSGYRQSGTLSERAIDSTPDAVQFDESDWDYEPPRNGSKWKWLIPATGLAAVFAASMVYVNKPELFQFNQPHIPELTIDTALGHAEEKIADGQYIFPAGESALDYYQLVLGSEPNNPEALAGVELIENQVREKIVQSVEENSLSEANRLLSRANQAGLSIDNIPSAGATDTGEPTKPGTSETAGGDSQTITAIDKDLSPFLTRRITEIEQEIENGNADAAEALFAQTDIYLPDPEMSSALKLRIEAVRRQTADQSDAAPATSNTVTANTETTNAESTNAESTNNNEILSGADNSGNIDSSDIESASDTAPPITNSLGDADRPYPNAEIPARASQSAEVDNNSTGAASGEQRPDATVTAAITSPSNSTRTPAATANVTANGEPAADRPVSAPRRSYIDGSGAPARHLNQLRTAIEAKNLNRVLQVSDNLPTERVDFLKQMFRRYDRLDVVIDRIRDQSGQLTANLNVSMFNQRGDGSYYSAGRWNGVTVKSNQVDNQWQKIEW